MFLAQWYSMTHGFAEQSATQTGSFTSSCWGSCPVATCGWIPLATRARVSLCLSMEVRGQGLGRRILSEADRLGSSIGFERLDAEIHPENRASRRVFEAAGYMQGDPLDGFLTCHRYLKGAK